MLIVVHEQYVDTIQRIERGQGVRVGDRVVRIRNSEGLLISCVPEMRMGRLYRRTDIDRITEDMRRMNGEVHDNGTVTTKLIRHSERVFTRYIERIRVGSIHAAGQVTPCVRP